MCDRFKNEIAHDAPHFLVDRLELSEYVLFSSGYDLRGSRRRGSTHVRHHIRDRPIDLVSYGRDDRYLALPKSPRQHFIIECPEILGRTAAAAHDQGVYPLAV